MNLIKPLIITIMIPFFALSSCKEEILHKGKTPLVSVGKEFLYKEDVQRFCSANPPSGDSIEYVNRYINRWIEEALFYNVALRNVPVAGEVEKLVESYKRSLILNLYQEGLVEQHLRPAISDEEVQEFYNSNIAMFELEEPIFKGLFLKVPAAAPKLSSLRKWYKSREIDDLEKLDKYSITNNVVYESFQDAWERLAVIASKASLPVDELAQRLGRDKDIEFRDKEYVYFLSVDSFVNKGSHKPVELVEGEIRELVTNTLKAEFIKENKRNIYDEAVKRGAIEYYNK